MRHGRESSVPALSCKAIDCWDPQDPEKVLHAICCFYSKGIDWRAERGKPSQEERSGRGAGRTTSMLLSRACWHRSLQYASRTLVWAGFPDVVCTHTASSLAHSAPVPLHHPCHVSCYLDLSHTARCHMVARLPSWVGEVSG